MKKAFVWILLLFVSITVSAQKIAVKTNLLYDVTTTLNIGAEFRLAPKWTLDVSGNYNPFKFGDDKKMKHWLVQPEARYWLCEAFNGHFFALHALGGQFNVGDIDFGIFPSTKGKRYEGNMFGAGLGYGYQFVLGNRWNLGLEIGLGWIHADFDKYECPHCGEWLGKNKKDYFGVTKAAVSLIYIINDGGTHDEKTHTLNSHASCSRNPGAGTDFISGGNQDK